jgi:hypothetical protein
MISQEKNKPLSQKPLGYLLAILGGTLGAPIGWIMSPVVLLILNNIMTSKNEKQPNRFLVWSLIGIIGAPLSLAPIIISGANTSSSTETNKNQPQVELVSQPRETEKPRKSTGVNKENYLKLQNGMSYQEVVNILGKEGEEMSSSDIGGTRTVMYMWKAGGFGGANMNAMFQDDALTTKAQFGLD